MASQPTSLLMEEKSLRATLNRSLPTCPEVIGTIYMDHYRYVLQVCRRFFRQPEDAEDAAAEVFLKLHRVLDNRDEALPFRPWVSRVAGRHCIDKLRQRKREKTSCMEEMKINEFPDYSTLSPLSRILRDEKQRLVREEVTRLPEHYKVPLVLRYYNRMSCSEIARALNRRLPTVRTLIFRAKNQLRRNLQRFEIG